MDIRNCLLLFVLVTFFACGNQTSAPSKEESGKTTAAESASSGVKSVVEGGESFFVTSNGTKIPKAEKGITIVSETGWTKQEMDFQISYCGQMMQNQKDINGDVFCKCFLDKIQYFYEPIYASEAYTDQVKWNSQCIELAQR